MTADPLLWGAAASPRTWPLIALLWAAAAVALIAGRWTATAAGSLAALVLPCWAPTRRCGGAICTSSAWPACCSPAGDAASTGRCGSDTTSPTRPAWPILLLRVQLSAVCLFAGIAKINEDFLSGLVLYQNLATGMLTGWLPPQALGSQALLTALAGAVVAVELWLAVALWVTRWLRANFAVAVAFHASMLFLAQHGGQLLHFALFAVLMSALLLAFAGRLRACDAHGGPRVGSAGFEPATSRV